MCDARLSIANHRHKRRELTGRGRFNEEPLMAWTWSTFLWPPEKRQWMTMTSAFRRKRRRSVGAQAAAAPTVGGGWLACARSRSVVKQNISGARFTTRDALACVGSVYVMALWHGAPVVFKQTNFGSCAASASLAWLSRLLTFSLWRTMCWHSAPHV